ncbi:MAG: YceI family protein [Gemmatimonadaceae bacterium]
MARHLMKTLKHSRGGTVGMTLLAGLAFAGLALAGALHAAGDGAGAVTGGSGPGRLVDGQAVPDARLVEGLLAFDANSSVGDFGGETRQVSGEVRGGASPGDVRATVRTEAASLRTGISARDGHMRESLDAEHHPQIRLAVEAVEAAGTIGDTVQARVHGTLTIRGISRPVTVPVTAVRQGAGFVVRASFPVDLRDYEITGLRRMLGMLRVDPMVTVRAELTFQPDAAPGGN